MQECRKELRGFTRLPSATLFYSKVDEDRDWAFHVGGLTELQFNWAPDGKRSANYAVAPIPDDLVAPGMLISIGTFAEANSATRRLS